MKIFFPLFLFFLFLSANFCAAVSSQKKRKQEVNSPATETKAPPSFQTNRKVSGIFDDVLEGLRNTIEDMERLDELTGESGRVHVMISGLNNYLDEYNHAVLYDEVTGVLWRDGNYDTIDLEEIEEWADFRKKGSTQPVPKERARALSLTDLGVLEINIIRRMHNGYSKAGILKMTTKATIHFTLFQAALGHIMWQKTVNKTVYGVIGMEKENYNKNMHGVTLKDTNIKTLVMTALKKILPELPKKYQ